MNWTNSHDWQEKYENILHFYFTRKIDFYFTFYVSRKNGSGIFQEKFSTWTGLKL